MTCDTWHMKGDMWLKVNILYKFHVLQLPCRYTPLKWCPWKKEVTPVQPQQPGHIDKRKRMNQFMNDKGICRTVWLHRVFRKGEHNFPFSLKKRTLKTLKPFKSCNNSDRASFYNIAMSFLFDICSTFVLWNVASRK